MESAENKEFIYEFGQFVLDPHERVLLAGGKPVHLTDKVFDTLLFLIKNNGRRLTKEEMMAAIWEDAFVEEGNLAKNISRLRKILNTDGASLIETLPKHGYRFLADVKQIDGGTNLLVHRRLRIKITHTDDEDVETEMLPAAPRSSQWKQPLLAFGILSILIMSAFGFYFWKREKSAPVAAGNEIEAARLTDNPGNDSHPRWTKDGRIRFFRIDARGQTESLIMNADGTNQLVVKDFNNLQFGVWSPDAQKVIFAKSNDKTAYYAANADGSNEIALPFYAGNFDWSFDGREIVYQKAIEPNNSEIFIYSTETGESRNITNSSTFDADPSFSPDGRQIVFVSSRDGNNEIYVMNADGSNALRLTNHLSEDSHPVFSPDGTQIAFTSDRENENADVYLINSDASGGARKLTDWNSNETVEPGCWSADGARIAFFSDRNGKDDIYVVSAEVFRPQIVLSEAEQNLSAPTYSPDGKKIAYQAELADKSGELRIFDLETRENRLLAKNYNADIAPVWSPGGELIAFQNRIDGNTEICLIKPDGSGLKNLTNHPSKDSSPAWSPDGRQIVFTSNRDGNTQVFQIYAMNADGTNQHRIYYVGGISSFPAWSPDGKKIVFANDKEDGRSGNFEIFTIEPETGEAVNRLTFRRRFDTQPVFSPDGKRIAFVSEADGNPEIYLMQSDGAGLLRLTRNAAEDISPRWSNDGRKIIFSSNRRGKFAIYEIEIP